MRKDHLHRRSKDADATAESTEVENGDPLSGSADPFDALVSSKSDDTARTNGKKQPSPIPDDSDNENDNEETKNDDNSETNGDSADDTNNGDVDAENADERFEVEDIVGHKFKGKKILFRIRWKNYGDSDDTWELEESLSCPEIIERYLTDNPDAKVTNTKEKKEKKAKKEKKVSRFQILFVRPCRWHDKFHKTKNGILLKVRISLPSETPTRATPKRTAAERKSVVDSDDESTIQKKKSPLKKRGRPRKDEATKGGSAKKKEFEVQKIVDDEIRAGKKFYRIRWKGWSAKDDTWEPKTSLSCPEIIKAYESSKDDNQEYEVEKIVGEKIEYGSRFFLVKWKGWPESDNSWEAEKSVDCYELIEKFRDSCRSSGKSNKRSAATTPKSPKNKKPRKSVSDDDDDENDEENDGDESDEKEWEVEKVVNVRSSRGGKKEYLIRWKGCKASEDTWEPENGISCPSLINAFLKKNKK